MKVQQEAGRIWRFSGSGLGVTFGRQVPRGLTVQLDPGLGGAVEVRPGTVLKGAFRSLELRFPAVVGTEDLDVFIEGLDGFEAIFQPALPQAFRVSSGSDSLLASVTFDITLPPVADSVGSVDGLELFGAVQVTATSNLPNAYLYWTGPDGNILMRWDRFTAVSALGKSYFKITGWPYPLNGGKLSIANGATSRTLKHDLFSIRK